MKLVLDYMYDYTIGIFLRYYEKLSRALIYFKLGWSGYDWDYMSLLQLEVVQLKRMLKVFENDPWHSPECPNYKPKLKSIRLAVKLGEKLLKDDYYKFLDLHNIKWGEPNFFSDPIDSLGNNVSRVDAKLYRFRVERDRVNTDEDRELERNEFREAYMADERMKTRDRRVFYAIIGKYLNYWWT